MSPSPERQRAVLARIAERAMTERGLLPEFGPEAMAEVRSLTEPRAEAGTDGVRDLRALLWCSIDNDDSRDLDQLSAAEPLAAGAARVRVAVADVSALVSPGTAIDRHAKANTTSVYTPGRMFPMLPERLSTDLSSLNPGEDRLAVVIEMVLESDGSLTSSDVYRAWVHNRAKLAYPSVGAWLEDKGPLPGAAAAVAGLEASLRLQDRMAQALRERRHEQGALDLETIEVRVRFEEDDVADLEPDRKNPAKELIEDFMIAANGVIARFLAGRGVASLRRVVRSPERWQRIVDLAAEYREKLPADPDAKSLEGFLRRRRAADPLRFPDLSLTVVKLLGKGEYVVESPQSEPTGHFGLAVRDYTHSTAPNRRYPDLITQRLVRAALAGSPPTYDRDTLRALAEHCTEREDAANKVERRVKKSAAALLLSSRIGQRFSGVVTGASPKGTWVRVFQPPVEGRLESGFEGLDVGDKVEVKLVHTDVERGFIDFHRAR